MELFIIISDYDVAAGESMASARYALYTKRTRGKVVCGNTFPPPDANFHFTSCEHTTKSCPGRQQNSKHSLLLTSLLTGGSWSMVQGVCQLHALQEDQQLLLPSWTLLTASATLSGKLAAVMHEADILQSSTPYCYCVGEAMCFNPITKHDENDARHDNEDEGMAKEGS